MPRARKGPKGPKKGAGGKKGTNRRTPHSGAGTSGMAHEKRMTTKRSGY